MLAAPTDNPTLAAARAAFATFQAGLAGDRAALDRFIAEMHPEMVLYFPQGPNLSKGAYRGDEIRELFSFVRTVYNTGLFITLDNEFVAGDTVAFQFHDEAVTRDGAHYRGCVVISFKMRDGKLFRYREHFGLRWDTIPPADEPPPSQAPPTTLDDVRAVAERYLGALGAQPGALEAFLDRLADDAVLYFPAREEIAGGAYTGKEAIRDLILRRAARTENGIAIQLDRAAVGGDSGGFACHTRSVAAGSVDQSTLFLVIKMKDGRAWRIREYYGPKWGDVVPPHDEDIP
ncbi:MAG: nuclear transport factor 2 family protein [Chloroflexota bacterium]|nr:nuclear transport factor 2 family protein [Dehalococcoidia bacterium]MDW8255149.1 nuclear transport factor 2 family protein [Chloroflexota bacterium]